MDLTFLRMSFKSSTLRNYLEPMLCDRSQLRGYARAGMPRLWLMEIPSNSSAPTPQNISLSRQTQESGIKESLSWGTQRTQDALYEARAPLERGHSAEIPVGQPGKLVSPPWRGL